MAKTIALQTVEIGKESTWGTPVAASKKLAGITSIELQSLSEVSDFPSLEGYAPMYQSDIVRTGATATIESLVVYEDLPIWLDSLLAEDATPTGAGPYTYVYEAPLTAAPTRSFYTIQYGDSDTAYCITGALVKSVTISGSAGEALSMSIEIVGHHIATDTMDGNSDRTVNIATARQTVLSMNAVSSAPGVTAIACSTFDFEISLDNATAVVYQIGAITPCDYFQNRMDGMVNLTMEFPGPSDEVADLYDAFIGTTPAKQSQNIELKASNGANLDIELQCSGVLMSAPSVWSDSDGVTTMELEFKMQYNANVGASGNFFAANVINGISDQFA